MFKVRLPCMNTFWEGPREQEFGWSALHKGTGG